MPETQSSGNIELLDQFMNQASEAHSFQDAAVYGVLLALFVTGQIGLLGTVAALLGLGGAKAPSRRILKRTVEDLVRMDDIRDAPEYALMGFVTGFGITGAGIVAAAQLGYTELSIMLPALI